MIRHARFLLFVFLMLALFAGAQGCKDNAFEELKSSVTALFKGGQDGKKSEEAPAPETKNPAETGQPGENMAFDETPVTYAGSHILIAYQGAMRAKAEVVRSKEDALKLAKDLNAQVLKDPSKFEEIAKKNSDCPSGEQGGDLGSWLKGSMTPEFDKAIGDIKEGDIAKEPVESPFGFHVIRRNKAPEQVEVAALHILVAYKGSIRAPESVTRTKDEAAKRAAELSAKAKAAPDQFLALAKENSDDRNPKLPAWVTGTDQMPGPFDQALLKIKIGEVSDPVETPFGFHVFRRTELPPKMAGAHILIQYKGAEGAPETLTRSKEEALKRLHEAETKIKADISKFGEIAKQYSEDPSAPMNGGDLGVWSQGQMVPEFEEAIAKIKIGELSQPVESPFGYHLILRKDPAQQAPEDAAP